MVQDETNAECEPSNESIRPVTFVVDLSDGFECRKRSGTCLTLCGRPCILFCIRDASTLPDQFKG